MKFYAVYDSIFNTKLLFELCQWQKFGIFLCDDEFRKILNILCAVHHIIVLVVVGNNVILQNAACNRIDEGMLPFLKFLMKNSTICFIECRWREPSLIIIIVGREEK